MVICYICNHTIRAEKHNQSYPNFCGCLTFRLEVVMHCGYLSHDLFVIPAISLTPKRMKPDQHVGQKIIKYPENIVYHYFRQLWLVLWVKLMEINNNQ